MVRDALRQYARSIGFSEWKGIAYGDIDGYTVTLAQGGATDVFTGRSSGAYNIWVNVYFPRDENYVKLMTRIKDVRRTYSVLDQYRYPHGIRINLGGSLTKFRAFIAWLMPLIAEYDGQTISKCPLCGQAYTAQDERVYARLQGMAVPAHPPCIDQAAINREIEAQEDKQVGRGALGAVLGAFLGSLPWIISYLAGFFIWVFGFMIGIGATIGYKQAGGKPCGKKYGIILLCVVFFSAFSFFASIISAVAIDIFAGDLQGGLWGNVTALLRDEAFFSREMQRAMIGFICSLAGCVHLIGEIRQEFSSREMIVRLP